MIEKNNNMGTINISLDVVATIAGGAATECYGVVGMASKKRLKDGYYDLLRSLIAGTQLDKKRKLF